MAKRKKRKDNEEKESKHGFELTGLLWILISIIGFGGEEIFGPVGKIISNFCIFLSGSLWVVPLIFVFVFFYHVVGLWSRNRVFHQIIEERLASIENIAVCNLKIACVPGVSNVAASVGEAH